jgi:hypothetical protein
MKKLKNWISNLFTRKIVIEHANAEDDKKAFMLAFSMKRALQRSLGSIDTISCMRTTRAVEKEDGKYEFMVEEKSFCRVCMARRSRIVGLIEEFNDIIKSQNISI